MVTRPFPARHADAEAAAWIARLQADDRSSSTDAGLQEWLRADPANADAFERATELWAMLPGVALCADAATPVRQSAAPQGWATRRQFQALAASALLLIGVGAGWWLFDGGDDYGTRRGEQKVATLEDGSRIALNTDTEVEVRYARDERRVTLERGEAMFDVAPNHARPFLVTAGDKQIRALGTSFIVRRTGSGVVVTLLEGKVSVTDRRAVNKSVNPTILAPGERLTANADAPSTIDQPAIDAVTAWRRGQAVFSDTPLSAAVAELNRYGGPHIAVEDPHLASLRVSGVFATSDTTEFAAAIAALHGLRIQKTGTELRIVR
ncbi:FecR family protein [Sphingomonas sp. S2-65]|uniref:FecR family protein n=1 Tax=Sphingomonas sp. S2-65 TaxID=2903960 RepID=UPI001F394CDE|nr:FecR domain-containing protein [Sphingomonas sp. S2-65]UYY59181.1 FecR domain-containing protein [Sphingomonas sp. S2-65]